MPFIITLSLFIVLAYFVIDLYLGEKNGYIPIRYGISEEESTNKESYNVKLHSKRLVNEDTKKLFFILNKMVSENNISAYIFARISYGEIIGAGGKDAFAAFQTFNSKVADFLIVDLDFNPLFVIEYHEEEHFKDADMERNDGIKYAACKGAGIGYLTIHYKDKNNLIEYLEIELLPKLKEIIGVMNNG